MKESSEFLLGIDVGTSTVKVAALEVERCSGRGGGSYHVLVRASAQEPYATSYPRPGWAEQDPEEWWQKASSGIRQVVGRLQDQYGIAAARVRAVAVSGQGHAATLVGPGGEALGPALIWLDMRAQAESEEIAARLGDRLLAITGKAAGAYNQEARLLWLRRHEPERFCRAWKFLTTTGYIIYRLTREPVTNLSDAGLLFAFDVSRLNWSEEVLTALELPRSAYPQVLPCTARAGRVTPEAAAATGLAPDTLVVAGGEDTSAAAMAIGAYQLGHGYISLGTAATIGVLVDHPILEPRLLLFPHVVPDLWILNGSMTTGGAGLEWFARHSDHASHDSFDSLTSEAAASAPGADGLIFLPYLSGEMNPILDPRARAVFFGLSHVHTRAHMVRAIMEGTGFALRHNQMVAEASGGRVSLFRVVGRPTRSRVWMQAIADILGRPLSVVQEPASSSLASPIGDALLAGVGAGVFPDAVTAATAWKAEMEQSAPEVVTPRPEYRDRYDRLFQIYLSLYPALREQFAALASLP